MGENAHREEKRDNDDFICTEIFLNAKKKLESQDKEEQ